jgi:hypothetical protein
MVPKLFKSGKSFKTLSLYLLHDPKKAKTAERVHWTHTLNLASDHPALAVDEMLWTYRAAEDLKRQAGVPAGGRPLENPVRHFSLNWHPSETPLREHMIETVESFLAHMHWGDRQALIVCHEDKHPHVHVMVNSVHPETGRALDTSFEKRRAQEWALEYERTHQLIFCEERLKPIDQRTPSPTRATWEQLRTYEREDDRAQLEKFGKPEAYFERNDGDTAQAREWEALKTYQRLQRMQFFADGKEAYRQVRHAAYREVRTEFREEWRGYYKARREGMEEDRLTFLKSGILQEQQEALDERRSAACAELREQRDLQYLALLTHQKEERQELRDSQDRGERSYDLFDVLYPVGGETTRPEDRLLEGLAHSPLLAEARLAAAEICAPSLDGKEREEVHDEAAREPDPAREPHLAQNARDPAGGAVTGALGAVTAIGERLFDGFFGGDARRPKHDAARDPAAVRDAVARRAVAGQRELEAREADEARVRGWWEERRHRGRGRD